MIWTIILVNEMCDLDDWADTGFFRNTIDDPKLDEQNVEKEFAEVDNRSSDIVKKEFTEQELFSGFMKTLRTSTKEVAQIETPRENIKVKKPQEESPEKRKYSKKEYVFDVIIALLETSIKKALMNEVARWFGESGLIDFNHLPEESIFNITQQSLKDKINSK